MAPRDMAFDWGDLRFLKAVAETGSTLAAARALGINQTTVARRLAALEAALGLKLVERLQSGYQLTEDGEMALEHANRIAAAADELQHQAEERRCAMSGVVRLTLTEPMATHIVAPALADFNAAYPDIQVQMLVEDRRLDLMKGEADMALRAGYVPDTAGLYVRRIVRECWSLFCSRDYAEKHGLLASLDELPKHSVVRCEGSVSSMPAMVWLKEMSPTSKVGSVSTSLATAFVAARAGLGIAALPTLIASRLDDLVQCYGGIPGSEYDFFLLTRESQRHLPRVKALSDYLYRHIQDNFGV